MTDLDAVRQEQNARADRCLFFGVWRAGQAGHYLTDRHRRSRYELRWMTYLDGDLPPLDEREEERRATVTHIHGWTALAMWDRTGDPRGRCNAVFWMPGSLSFEAMLAVATEAFPEIIARIGGPITHCVEVAKW